MNREEVPSSDTSNSSESNKSIEVIDANKQQTPYTPKVTQNFKTNTALNPPIIIPIETTELIVDPEYGPFKTIQSAIDVAKPHSRIKVFSGLYKENLTITKGPLQIEAKDSSSEVYIMGLKGPTIFVNLPADDESTQMKLSYIRLTHKGGLSNQFYKHLNAEDRYDKSKLEFDTVDDEKKLFKCLEFGTTQDSLIFLKRGMVHQSNCYMNMNMVTKCNQLIIPAVLLEQKTSMTMMACDQKGTHDFASCGIGLKNANLTMNRTTVSNFSKGGVLLWVTHECNVKLLNSKFSFNSLVGIQILGNSQSPLIQSCVIEKNDCCGIQVCTANQCNIRKNEISNNQIGIEILSSDPYIYNNKISRNYQEGIVTRTIDDLLCKPVQNNNEITSNALSGIYCTGRLNKTKIFNNPMISYNKGAGVKVDGNAHVLISKNDIYKNIMQGILIIERSSAHVEGNYLKENIKANLAFGGENSCNTVVLNNKISGGRCEGVFIIDGGRAQIHNNDIYGNFDGIICLKSFPEIYGNKIQSNKSNGVMIMRDAQPIMNNNAIVNNSAIGVLIKDKSKGVYVNNKIKGNDMDMVMDHKCVELANLKGKNRIYGEIRVSGDTKCVVF